MRCGERSKRRGTYQYGHLVSEQSETPLVNKDEPFLVGHRPYEPTRL